MEVKTARNESRRQKSNIPTEKYDEDLDILMPQASLAWSEIWWHMKVTSVFTTTNIGTSRT